MIRRLFFGVARNLFGVLTLVVVTMIFTGGQISRASAQTLFDVRKLLEDIPLVIPMGSVYTLNDGDEIYEIQVDVIKALGEVHSRIGLVAKVGATLAIVVDPSPQAMAIPFHGKNLIIVTTGMLDIVGSDKSMMAALVGHEYAHLLRRHSFQRALQIPTFVYGAVSVGREVSRRTGSRYSASKAAQVTYSVLKASFSREQEVEADKVGTELMSEANFNPDGASRLISELIKHFGGRSTGYFDSHPGLMERLANAAPTVLNQRYDSIAVELSKRKDWRELRGVVDRWIKASPESARAWYYQGILHKRSKRPSMALAAFDKSVNYDPHFIPGRLALCIELYEAKKEMESLVCSEYLPKNEVFDEFVAKTFKHVVHVGGFIPRKNITEQDVKIVNQIMGK